MLFLFHHVKAAAKATDLTPFLITYRFFLSGSADLGRGPWRGRSVFLSVNMSADSFSDDHPGSCRYSLRLLPGVRSEEGRLFSLRVPVAGLPSAPVLTVPNMVCGTWKRELGMLRFW